MVIADKAYLRIEGLRFQNFSSNNDNVPTGLLITGKSHDILINDCQISHIQTKNPNAKQANAHALAVYGDQEVPIYHLDITNCDLFQNSLGLSEALVLNGNVKKFTIAKNKIRDNDNIGIDMIGFEGTAPKNDFVREGICEQNELWNNSTTRNPSYQEASSASIYVDGGRDIVIQQNTIWQSDIGIEAASEHYKKATQQIVIRNNLIYDCKEIAGIAFGGYDHERGSDSAIKIYNNTLVNNLVHILVQEHAQVPSNEIVNNILYQGEPYEGDLTAIEQTMNFIGDPIFVDEETGDFHLSTQSPARNQGIVNQWGGTANLDRKQRVENQKIHLGAFQ